MISLRASSSPSGQHLSDVIISELREGTFFARLNVEGNSAGHEIDARPSDAIAIAIRFGVPIYVSEAVMEEASGIPESEEGEQAIRSIPKIGSSEERHVRRLIPKSRRWNSCRKN